MLVYSVETGRVMAKVPSGTPFHSLYNEELASLEIDNVPSDWYNYKVIGTELVKLSPDEIIEIKQHGKLLSSDERVLMRLIPPSVEVKKAERAIETLLLLQEVL